MVTNHTHTHTQSEVKVRSPTLRRCQRVNSDGCTHFLEMLTKRWILSNVIPVLYSKFVQFFLELFQLFFQLENMDNKREVIRYQRNQLLRKFREIFFADAINQ